jgi:hypothetical protein
LPPTVKQATLQAFAQANYKLSEKLTANLGVHTLALLLNNSRSVEPRASLKWDLATGQSWQLAMALIVRCIRWPCIFIPTLALI